MMRHKWYATKVCRISEKTKTSQLPKSLINVFEEKRPPKIPYDEHEFTESGLLLSHPATFLPSLCSLLRITDTAGEDSESEWQLLDEQRAGVTKKQSKAKAKSSDVGSPMDANAVERLVRSLVLKIDNKKKHQSGVCTSCFKIR